MSECANNSKARARGSTRFTTAHIIPRWASRRIAWIATVANRNLGSSHVRAADFDIDLAASWVVGDRYSDVELARNAGVKSVFVLSGYGRGEWEHQRASWKTKPDQVAEDLLKAVQLIVADSAELAGLDLGGLT